MNRVSFLLGRLLQMVVVLWVVATLLFLIFRLMPGNPLVAYIDTNFTAEMQQTLLRQFGLDRPLHVQYAIFLGNLVRGEFGRSFFSREPVSQVMWQVLHSNFAKSFASCSLKTLLIAGMTFVFMIFTFSSCESLRNVSSYGFASGGGGGASTGTAGSGAFAVSGGGAGFAGTGAAG